MQQCRLQLRKHGFEFFDGKDGKRLIRLYQEKEPQPSPNRSGP